MSTDRGVFVVKSNGEREPYDERKMRRALKRAGANDAVIARVLDRVRDAIRPEISTSRLYRIAFDILRRAPKPTAARYSMERAVIQLGPSGYPFERFVGEVFQEHGYRVRTGTQVGGAFVTHEIDVDARRDGERHGMECKFRNLPSGKVDVRTALYVYARWLDLRDGPNGPFDRYWLVTNGKFTSDAIAYGDGVGLDLCSWSWPERGNLRELIEDAGVHPVTCLSTLRVRDKRTLVERGVVLVRQLRTDRSALRALDLRRRDERRVLEEIDALSS